MNTKYKRQTISRETARLILECFKKNSHWDNCGATSEQNKEVVYWRKDTPYLEELQRPRSK